MNQADTAHARTETCELCEEHEARPATTLLRTSYGGREIEYVAPVWHCDGCGGEYTAEGSEEAEQDAIHDVLGRLRPAQIRGLRNRLGLTQVALAFKVRTSRDSVIRWEAGSGVQSVAADERLRELLEEVTDEDRRREHNERYVSDVSDRYEAANRFRLFA